MISKNKKYFTFFGILAASVDMTINSMYSSMNSILSKIVPIITSILLSKQLKPINLYSTNKIK